MRDLEIIQHSHKQSDVCSAKTQSVRHPGNVLEEGHSLAAFSHNSNSLSQTSNRCELHILGESTTHHNDFINHENIHLGQLNEISELSCEQRLATDESQRALQTTHSLTNLHLNLVDGDNPKKKRPIGGRVNHESRLQNLVQTIQKYKNESETKGASTPTGLGQIVINMSSSQATLEA